MKELSPAEISAIFKAQGFEDETRLDPRQRAIVAHNLLHSAEFVSEFEDFLRRKYGAEIIAAMPQALRDKISDRVWAKWKVKKTLWVVDLYNGVTGMPCVKMKCHQCDAVDCWVPPNAGMNFPPARWTDKGPIHQDPFLGTVQVALGWAMESRFRHCGKAEEVPAHILKEYEQRLQGHLPPNPLPPQLSSAPDGSWGS